MQSNCCLMELELKEQRNCSKSFSPEYLNNGETSLLFGLKILLIEYHFGVESLKSHFFQALKESDSILNIKSFGQVKNLFEWNI